MFFFGFTTNMFTFILLGIFSTFMVYQGFSEHVFSLVGNSELKTIEYEGTFLEIATSDFYFSKEAVQEGQPEPIFYKEPCNGYDHCYRSPDLNKGFKSGVPSRAPPVLA